MTPEEIEKLLSPKEVVELPNTEVYQELEDSIVDSIVEEPYVLGSCGHLGCRGFTKRVDHSYCFNCKELVIGESPILN
jgi:hypothetical protein